jgi:hypothetical protein
MPARPNRSGALLLVTAAVLALSGCDGSLLGMGGESFTLRTINGGSLPYPFPMLETTREITAGSVVLSRNGRVTESMTVRCKSTLPPGTTCNNSGDGRNVREGRYSKTEGWVELGEDSDGSPFRYPATFAGRTVQITFGSGLSPRYTFEYRR